MKTSLFSFIFTVFFANSLMAQTVTQTSIIQPPPVDKNPWGFQVDLNFMRFDGSYGFGVGYDVLEKLSAELSYTHTNFYNKEYGLYSVSASTIANAYGLRLNYYPFSDVKGGGFYTSATVSQVELGSTIKGESMLSSASNSKDLKATHIGRQVFMGYHFGANNSRDGFKLTSRAGLGYGSGKSYGIREGWKDYEITDSVLFDASFLFSY